MSNVTQMSLPPSRIREAIIRALMAQLTPIVRSSPGVGKSDIIRGIAKEYRLKLIDFRLSQCDVTDLSGLPRFKANGRAEFAPFEEFPLEGDDVPAGYEGWLLFLDEITAAPKQVQAAAYKLILDREMGQKKLHEKVMIVAAGNLTTDNAVAYEMSTALQSRMIHLNMEVNKREWQEWAIQNGIDSRILGFLEYRSGSLHQFNPEHTDLTFPCPRTWEFTSRLIQGQPVVLDDLALLSGTVGLGAAREFIGYCEIYQDLPTIAEIIKDPVKAKMSEEPSAKYAIATYLADHLDISNADKLVVYLQRLPVECQVLCLRIANLRNPRIIDQKDVADMMIGLARQM